MTEKSLGFGVFLAAILGVSVAQGQSNLDQEIESLGLNVAKPNIEVTGANVSVPSEAALADEAGDIASEIRVLLRPASTTTLSSKAKGQIRSLPFDIGDTFKKGWSMTDIPP